MAYQDEGHTETEKRLKQLEKRIEKEFQKAANDLQKRIDDYFKRFLKKDEIKRKAMESGKITKDEYKQWRLNQIAQGRRFEALRDHIAERMTHAHEVAVAYINDDTPGIYSLNRNFAAYTIEQATDAVAFDIWDEQTVRQLLVTQPETMPYYPPKRAVQRGIDLAYGKRMVTNQVTQAILLGESIPQLTKRLQQNIPTMSKVSAIRAARTAVTAAQNAGRQDSYAAAEKMGIKLKKMWLATLDNRTRHAHRELDGQIVGVDEDFTVDGYKLKFPGDKSAPGYLVYNCRCTMIADLPEIHGTGKRRARGEDGKSYVIKNMTYTQWEEWKKKQNEKKGN